MLITLLLFCGIQLTFAQFPIPSYNACVDNRATFKEEAKQFTFSQNTDGKRILHVAYKSNKTLSDTITVYACSLDGQTLLGPAYLTPGQTISVEIDDREWGVLIYSDIEVVVDVWIE